jgi:hypothetical protein
MPQPTPLPHPPSSRSSSVRSSRTGGAKKAEKQAAAPDVAAMSQEAIQSGAERVFVTHPRVFSFARRALTSLRHPFLPTALLQCEADMLKAKKQWQTKAERLADMLTEGTAAFAFEEERWKNVAYMLDSVIFEADISQRRQSAIEAPSLRRALETWWCKAGGTTTRGVGEREYKRITAAVFDALIDCIDPVLQPIVDSAIDADWAVDSGGGATVEYGQWYISMLEVADNWLPVCDGDAYAKFLHQMAKQSGAAPVEDDAVSLQSVASAAPEDWTAVCQFLAQNAVSVQNFPVIRAKRSLRATVEYEKCLMDPVETREEEVYEEEDEEADSEANVA